MDWMMLVTTRAQNIAKGDVYIHRGIRYNVTGITIEGAMITVIFNNRQSTQFYCGNWVEVFKPSQNLHLL